MMYSSNEPKLLVLFLERLRTSSVIQSGSLVLGAGGKDSQAFRMENLNVSHTEFKVEV